MTRNRLRSVACLVAALAMAGCSGESTDSKGGGDSKTVTVLTHDSFNLPKELVKEFESKTGYKLVTTPAGDAGVANQLVLTKKSPKYDAVYGIDSYTAAIPAGEGLFVDYASPALPQSAKEYEIKGIKGLTPVDRGDVCINVDHKWFKEKGVKEPTGVDDLAKPEYSKLLSIIDPNASTTGFAYLAGVRTAKGEDAKGYLSRMAAGGVHVASDWTNAYNVDFSAGEGKGNYPLVLSYASSPAFAKDTGVIESTCVRQIEYAGVVKGTDNEKGAKAFVDFMVSKKVQSAIPTSMYMYPVDSSVQLPAEWAAKAKLAEHPIVPDPEKVAANRDKWLEDWAAVAK